MVVVAVVLVVVEGSSCASLESITRQQKRTLLLCGCEPKCVIVS